MDDGWVPALQEIMKSCWKQDPSERPEMKDIMTSLRKLPEASDRRRPGLAKTPGGESSKIYNQIGGGSLSPQISLSEIDKNFSDSDRISTNHERPLFKDHSSRIQQHY